MEMLVHDQSAASNIKTRRAALKIFVVAFIIYNFPLAYDLVHKPFFGWAPGQDIASTSLLPVSILERGDFYLDPYLDFFTHNWISPYFVAEVNSRLVSRYPVAAAVLAVPFYGIPLGTGWLAHPGYAWLEYPWSAFFPAKFAAAFMIALTATMFFFCARELADLRTSVALTIAFAFGTSVWSTASQGLWQQTPSLLFQIIGIWFLLRARRKGARAAAPGAFFFSAATISRPNNVLIALLFTVYVLIYHGPIIIRWIVWSIPPALFFIVYNSVYNGSPFVFGYQEGVAQFFSAPRIDALFGLFISPSRGLFIYSPFFLLLPFSIWNARREESGPFYLFCTIAFVLSAATLTMVEGWDGGWGFGTRLLTDALPYATLLLIPILKRLDRPARIALGLSVFYAAALQSFGLWDYGARWHWHWDNYKYNVWDWTENEPLFYFKEYLGMAQYYLSRWKP